MKVLIFLLALVTFKASAFSVPSAPSSPSGYDEVRTSRGTTCRASVGGNLQLYGGLVDAQQSGGYYGDEGEQGAFVGFAYSFGSESRIRCDRLAEIETEMAELELQKLQQEVAAYKQMLRLQQLEANGSLPKLN